MSKTIKGYRYIHADEDNLDLRIQKRRTIDVKLAMVQDSIDSLPDLTGEVDGFSLAQPAIGSFDPARLAKVQEAWKKRGR